MTLCDYVTFNIEEVAAHLVTEGSSGSMWLLDLQDIYQT